jgi:hypothetical protein
MRVLFWVGLVVLVLGVASLFMTIPQRETHGIRAGDVSVGVQTTEHRKVAPIVSAVMIIGGAGMMIAGGRTRV